jgi:hypothetical protein
MARRTTPRSESDDAAVGPPAPTPKAQPRKRARAPRGSRTATNPAGEALPREPSSPAEQDVRLRAYYRYLERGGGHGFDFDDWLAAELDLKKTES